MKDHILYTYFAPTGAAPVCHAYGLDTKEACEAEAEAMKAATPALLTMVLPLEPMPA